MRSPTDCWHSATVEQRDIQNTGSEPLAAGLLRTLSRRYLRLPSPMRVKEKQVGSWNYTTCGPPATLPIRLALLVIATGGTHG
jgi:hypothetical protein